MTSAPAESLKKIGIVSDAHGVRGDIYIIVFSGETSWVHNAKFITIQKPNSTEVRTLKLRKAKPFKKGFIAGIEGLLTRNQAEEIKKYEVLVDESIFISQDGEQPYLSELLGFEVTDLRLGKLGLIASFSSNGVQDLIVLDKAVNSQAIEIPFVEAFISNVDFKNKKMTTELPDGLIEINEKE